MLTVTTDPIAAHLADLIREFGWGVMAVGTGRCTVFGCCGGDMDEPFAYTVGLHAQRRSELIVRGLDDRTALEVLNDAARRLIEGGVHAGAPVMAAGASWMPTPATPADRADMRYARAFARGSARRLAHPLRLDRTAFPSLQ